MKSLCLPHFATIGFLMDTTITTFCTYISLFIYPSRGLCLPQATIFLLANELFFLCSFLMAASNDVHIVTLPKNETDPDCQITDYSQRAQWLRAAVLGANDGLVSIASLMMGVGAVKTDVKAMILIGFAGLVAGASSMAIGEFVSVYSQLDIEVAQMKRENGGGGEEEGEKEQLPNPVQAASASALAFTVGAIVPLLAASFIGNHKVRLGVVVAAVTVALAVFGAVGAVLGKTSVAKSGARVVVGGWMAMAITFGLTKLIGSNGLQM